MNTWMNNPQYLAQVGHLFGACSVLLTTGIMALALGAGWLPVLVVLAAGVAAAAVKEFWYDMQYELPRQTWGDSAMDFGFYVLGAGLGTGLFALALRLRG
jgi:hypothetical protein